MISNRLILLSVRWSVVGSIGQKVLDLTIFVILARLLGPEPMGLVAIASVFVALLGPISSVGMDLTLIQRRDLVAEHLDAAFWSILVVSSAAALALFFMSPMIAGLFDEPALAPILRGLALLVVLQAMAVLPDALCRRDMNYAALTMRLLVAKLVGGGVGIAAAFAGLGAHALVLYALAGAAASLLLLWVLVPWRPRWRFPAKHARDLFVFARHVWAFGLLSIYNRRSPALFIGFFLGPAAAGYFAVAERVLSSVISLLTSSINGVAVPMFSRMQDDPARTWRVLLQATSMVALISFPVCVGLALVADGLVKLVLGAAWTNSVVAVQIVILGGLTASVGHFSGSLLVAVGRPGLRTIAAGLRAGLGTLLFVALQGWGLAGMAFAQMLRRVLVGPVQLALLARAFEPFRWREYLGALRGTVLATLVMAAAVLSLQQLQAPPWPASLDLMVQVGVGVSVYVLASLLLNRSILFALPRLIARRS